jgi:D-threonate/D-erythronate kinase
MSQILIVADDLSGAADCGAAFARSGLTTLVLLSDPDKRPTSRADVLAVDADSRGLPAKEAAAACRRVVRRHWVEGQLLYKKIDSTLRGNVPSELAAIIPLAGLAIVAPAFPDTGRITRAGHVIVNGVLLQATETWRRQGMTGTTDIAAMLASAHIPAAHAALDLVRGDRTVLREAMEHMALDGAAAVICDAETNQDLAAIAAASMGLTRNRFWVGSAGLAHHLAQAAGIAGAAVPTRPRLHGPVVAIVGSLSAVSRAQAERLAAQPDITTLRIAPAVLRRGPSHPAWQETAAAIGAALQGDSDVLLTIAPDRTEDLAEDRMLSAALGQLLQPSAECLGGLIATGGDTARAVLNVLGADGLRLIREIEPGVVLSIVEGGRPLPMVTKAGAFGTPETLVHCRTVLRGTARSH